MVTTSLPAGDWVQQWHTRRVAQIAANLVAFAQNRTSLLEVLAARGIDHVEIPFDGSCDSGCVEEPDFSPPEMENDAFKAMQIGFLSGDAAGACTSRDLAIAEALVELTYAALEHHHPGWENNDGASGRLIIDVSEGTISLDCSVRYTASNDYCHSIGDEG